jgi:serine/threonine protein kinase
MTMSVPELTRDGVVKLLDFGLAKASADTAPNLTHSPTMMATIDGVLLGTAPYMSPEQARGRPVDKQRADIWSFGCVLYEMLAGRAAFPGETISDTIAAILSRDPDWSALPEAMPTSVRLLLQRCLEKDPKQRLRDIASGPAERGVFLRRIGDLAQRRS